MRTTLERHALAHVVDRALARSPVVLLVGPRQCGKTTLARSIAAQRPTTWFDLEDPEGSLRAEVAKQVLEPLRGLVVIDEFQHVPELFALVRVLADRRPLRARFLILGSASPLLSPRQRHVRLAARRISSADRRRADAGAPPGIREPPGRLSARLQRRRGRGRTAILLRDSP